MKLALPLRQFRPHRCVAQAAAAAAVAMWLQQLLFVLMALAVRFLLVPGDVHWLGSGRTRDSALQSQGRSPVEFEVEAEDTQGVTGSCLMTFST